MDYTIKYASKDDVEKINDIVNYYVANSTISWAWEKRSLNDAHKWFDSHDFGIHPIFVAKTKSNEVLGFASLSKFRPKSGYWPTAENSIYVDSKYTGHNIGTELMETLLNHAYSSKLEVVTAWIDSSNKKSIDFHKKWGFEAVGEMKEVGDKFDKRLSVTILQLSVK